MKLHLFRLTGLFVAMLLLSLVPSASAADKKPKVPRATPSPTDQLESARVATRKLPALAAEGTIKRESFELRLKVRRVLDDWELSLVGKQPMTVVCKDGNYYLSQDGGKSWRPTQPDDDLVSAVMAPLENGKSVGDPSRRPAYQTLGKESVNGEELIHLRLIPEPGDKIDAQELPEQWLVSDGRNGWLLRRSRSSIILFKQTVTADITYEALPGDAAIEVPFVGLPAKP
jgi:hypothetical protein